MLVVKLIDGSGGGNTAKVSPRGELIVTTSKTSTASTQTMGTDDLPVSFWPPIQDKVFIITDILLYANRNVGVNDATVTIYESTDGPASTTQSTVILSTEMLKQSSRDLVGLNLEVSEGSWINGVTDDDDVFATVMGYYVNA